MECKDAVAFIVEAVRSGREMPRMPRLHITRCAACSEREELERELASHFSLLREAASGRRSSPQSRASRQLRKDELMRQFSARHWRLVHPAWGIGLAAAAALLIVLGTVRGPLLHSRAPHVPPAIGVWLSSDSWSVEPSADAYSAQDEGYVPVPYAPPLAPGERLSVMHAELYPAALTNLGVTVDPAEIAASGNTVSADVVVGEDGLPRAVRVDRAERADGGQF